MTQFIKQYKNLIQVLWSICYHINGTDTIWTINKNPFNSLTHSLKSTVV